MTKIFPVLMMFLAYQNGLIRSMDDEVNMYVPEFSIVNPFSSESITWRQLASQLSGKL